MPGGASIMAVYAAAETGARLSPNFIYLVEHGRNIVFNLTDQELRFEKGKDYSLCLVSDGNLYLCNKEEFTNSTKNKGYKFLLTQLSGEANSVADLRKALEI